MEVTQILANIKQDLSDLANLRRELTISLQYIKLSNAVLTIYSTTEWDKDKLTEYIKKSGHNYKIPRAFSGISVKFFIESLGKEITIILFKSGKCVFVGITPSTIHGIDELFTKFIEIIKNSNCTTDYNFSYKISNKVYSFKLHKKDFPGTLADWYNNLPEARKYFEYNPTMFPGATLRIEGYSSVILLFNSRKGIVTGGKNESGYFKESMKYLEYYIGLLKNRLV